MSIICIMTWNNLEKDMVSYIFQLKKNKAKCYCYYFFRSSSILNSCFTRICRTKLWQSTNFPKWCWEDIGLGMESKWCNGSRSLFSTCSCHSHGNLKFYFNIYLDLGLIRPGRWRNEMRHWHDIFYRLSNHAFVVTKMR